jgi:two-component system NarL family sensor kinase
MSPQTGAPRLPGARGAGPGHPGTCAGTRDKRLMATHNRAMSSVPVASHRAGVTDESSAAIALGLTTVALVLLLGALGLTLLDHLSALLFAASVAVAAPLAAGLLIVLNRPANRIGWLLLFEAIVVALDFAVAPYAHYGLISHPGSLPGARWALLWHNADWPTLFALPVAVVLVFPDGRLPTRRWRRVGYAIGISLLVLQLAVTLEPQNYPRPYQHVADPLPSLPSAVRVALTPFWFGAYAGLFAAAWAIRVRFRRATGTERLQLLWLTYGGLLIPLTLVACLVEGVVGGRAGVTTSVALVAALTVVPASVGIAVLRYHLFDIELILSQTLVYAVLTACLAAVYLGLFIGIDRLVRATGVSGVVAAGVVALGFQPLRALLQRHVQRLVYGDRSDPYAAIARLGERLQAAPAPDDLLETIVDDVARALRLGFCAVALRRDGQLEVAAARGRSGRSPTIEIPLTHQGDNIGQLIVEAAPKSELTPSDRRLLEDLARQAGVAVHGVRLMADLQRSRENLVIAREEERLRLRRDLHDGLGPKLAALVFKIGLARDRIHRDPEQALDLLRGLSGDTQSAITDIRRLVYGLRPPALDELGLIGAIREQAEDLATSTTLEITITGPDLRRLPPAVEVAAFRIASEALTNAARHARGKHCNVTFQLTDRLVVEVEDDGTGLPLALRAGVGLQSMRERASELGGSLDIASSPGHGTRVHVSLPVTA